MRIIEDVIDFAEKRNKGCYIIPGFYKTFDSIEHNFMLEL